MALVVAAAADDDDDDYIVDNNNADDDADHQGHRFSAANFAELRGGICEIPLRYYPQIPYVLRLIGIVLTNNTSKYKELIVTYNTKTQYFWPLLMKIWS